MGLEEIIFPYLPEDEYAKAKGQFKLQLGGVFDPFRLYGLDAFIPGAIEEIVKLAEDFGMRVRGANKVISLDYIRSKMLYSGQSGKSLRREKHNGI